MAGYVTAHAKKITVSAEIVRAVVFVPANYLQCCICIKSMHICSYVYMVAIQSFIPCEKTSIDGSKYLYEDVAQDGATDHSKTYDSIQTASKA